MFTEADYEILAKPHHNPHVETVAIAAALVDIENPWATSWALHRERGVTACPHCGSMLSVDKVLSMQPCPVCEAEPMSAASALMRSEQPGREYERGSVFPPSGRVHLKESGDVLDLQEARGDVKEHVLSVILITEGLG